MRLPWLRVTTFVMAVALLPTAPAFAQSVGSISGTVMDASKAAIPGVVVTARNEGTSASREVVTDGVGPLRPAAAADRHATP